VVQVSGSCYTRPMSTYTVALLGAESTGKSALAELLAQRPGTEAIPEYARTFWGEHGEIRYEDMRRIAEKQVELEETAKARSPLFLFLDTTPLTTFIYSKLLHGKVDPALALLSQRPYDFTFLCAPDFPFVQDKGRTGEAFRKLQHEEHLRQLEERKIPYLLLEGTIVQRRNSVEKIIHAPASVFGTFFSL
jgi:HTH-type transcriptional regulator, transcriptional repressor of NAD biosynthesis genes